MSYSFRHTNPELAGVLVKEKVRCNRPNCRCMRRNQPHGWYYYLYWRDYRADGKLKKLYVPKKDVQKTKQKITSIKTKDRQEKINLQSYLNLIKQL